MLSPSSLQADQTGDGQFEPSQRSFADIITEAQSVIVKIGTNVATLGSDWWDGLILDLADLIGSEKEVVLVVSGAVELGNGALPFHNNNSTYLRSRRAARGAVGQTVLTAMLHDQFAQRNLSIAQMLIRQSDVMCSYRTDKLISTINLLVKSGKIPVINQDDTTDEFVSDEWNNDHVAAWLSSHIRPALVLFLTDVEGVFRTPPRSGQVIGPIPCLYPSDVSQIQTSIEPGPSTRGAGGMVSKLDAASSIARIGTPSIIMRGSMKRPIHRLLRGAPNTLVLPEPSDRSASGCLR